jgi:NAD-dependent SIR2 family protein deacetylase
MSGEASFRSVKAGGGRAMFTCTGCHKKTELDDATEVYDAEWCRCLTCHEPERSAYRPVPEPLRRQVIEVLAACEADP